MTLAMSASNGRFPTPRVEIEEKLSRLSELEEQARKIAVERESIVAWFESRIDKPAVAVAAPALVVAHAPKPVESKAPAPKTPTSARVQGMNAGSFAQTIVAHLEARPERAFKIAEIHAEIGGERTKRRVRSALHDLWKRNKIARAGEAGDGLYQALPRKEATPP
jgi:hypothetical protein